MFFGGRPDARAERAFPVAEASAAAARRFTRQTCRSWAIADAPADDAVLVVSELVTNVLRYARTPLLLALRYDGHHLALELTDGSPDQPTPRRLRGDSESGRGLAIVDALTTGWGTTATPVGKTVWAHLPTAAVDRMPQQRPAPQATSPTAGTASD